MQLKVPVILVVACRLGCINHAMLTVESILNCGLQLAGWVANEVVAGQENLAENIASLRQSIPAPMLAQVSFQTNKTDLSNLQIALPQ